MAVHLFSIGEQVSLSSPMRGAALQADIFVVKACMPSIGTRLQYRVRTIGEPYDRVVIEEQLTRLTIEDDPPEN